MQYQNSDQGGEEDGRTNQGHEDAGSLLGMLADAEHDMWSKRRARMKVVIDIPEYDYKLACNHPDALIDCYAYYIKAGVPLPKKYGRLIDADAYADCIESIIKRQGYDDFTLDRFTTVGEVLNAVIADLKGRTLYGYENAPTVIEAEGK